MESAPIKFAPIGVLTQSHDRPGIGYTIYTNEIDGLAYVQNPSEDHRNISSFAPIGPLDETISRAVEVKSKLYRTLGDPSLIGFTDYRGETGFYSISQLKLHLSANAAHYQNYYFLLGKIAALIDDDHVSLMAMRSRQFRKMFMDRSLPINIVRHLRKTVFPRSFVKLLARDGFPLREIASNLGLSPRTVMRYALLRGTRKRQAAGENQWRGHRKPAGVKLKLTEAHHQALRGTENTAQKSGTKRSRIREVARVSKPARNRA